MKNLFKMGNFCNGKMLTKGVELPSHSVAVAGGPLAELVWVYWRRTAIVIANASMLVDGEGANPVGQGPRPLAGHEQNDHNLHSCPVSHLVIWPFRY